MRWRCPLASALVGCSLAAWGCDAGPPQVAANDPDLLHAIRAKGGGEPAGLVRAQYPTEPATAQLAALPPAPAPADAAKAAPGVPAATIRATVNGEAILDEELRSATYAVLRVLEGLPEPERGRRQGEVLRQALDQLIEREVIYQDAYARINHNNPKALAQLQEFAAKEFEKSLRPVKEQMKLKNEEELKAFLKSQGVTYETAKRQFERQFIAMEYLKNTIYPHIDKIGHLQMAEYYETHPEEFKVEDAVDWQDIFILAGRHASREAARRFAEVLAARVRKGENFTKLSEQFDDGDGRLRNGAGIGRKRGEIKPPEAEATLFNSKPGDVFILEQTSGYHIIQLVKREYAGMRPFDDKTQKLIKEKLRNEVFQKESKRVIAELKRKAVIEIVK